MKLLFESWRGYLNEAELKYSETAAKEIFDFIVDAHRTKKIATISLPTDEVYYLNNNKIKNGIPLIWFGNVQHQDISKLPALREQWDSQTKTFKKDFLDVFLEKSYKLDVEIDGKMDSLGMATAVKIKGKQIFSLKVNPGLHKSLDQLKDTIRHELQHITQRLNGLALKYGEQLVAVGDDFSKLKTLELKDSKAFGRGKEKTGLKQVSRKRARELGISNDERVKRYLGDDFEYEAWMSDMLSDFTRWITKTKKISPVDLVLINYREQNPNMMASSSMKTTASLQEQDNIQKRKDIIQLAKSMNMKPAEVVKFYKTQPSFNTLAIRMASLILRSDKDLEQFAKDSNMPDYAKAAKTLKKLRPKEFAGDLVKNLELRLKKMAEENETPV
ncbi:MAG: hypothetical protein HOG49_01275 [Candidatus Scalindua sp.]|jgi:hypothetical protein|nr:hypothetical protein [Candidatus Scalindua sp.]